MPLKLKEKINSKDFKVTLPEELIKIIELYVQDSMDHSKYPEGATLEAREQVAIAAYARLISADKDFLTKHKEAADVMRKYAPAKKNSAPK